MYFGCYLKVYFKNELFGLVRVRISEDVLYSPDLMISYPSYSVLSVSIFTMDNELVCVRMNEE